MKQEFDEALCRDFPALYRNRHASMQETAMCWGFRCGDGWEPLIRTLSGQLTFLAGVEGNQPVVSTVKKKFGTLRFYVDNTTPSRTPASPPPRREAPQSVRPVGPTVGCGEGAGWFAAATRAGRQQDFRSQTIYRKRRIDRLLHLVYSRGVA